ncbi:hypothetical protein BGZ49_006451 [Haplosporangium sp. Z 27]|nr:hypothetical protein BGZ49_006451 [Haplosporangium sp. Z 27]
MTSISDEEDNERWEDHDRKNDIDNEETGMEMGDQEDNEREENIKDDEDSTDGKDDKDARDDEEETDKGKFGQLKTQG